MSDTLLTIFSSYGLPGLVILGLAFWIFYQSKCFQEERKLWNEERKAWAETNEKYLETSIEVIQANSKALAELTAFVQHEFYHSKN